MAFALPGMKSQQDAAPKSHIFRPPASPAHLATANSKLEGRSPWSCTGHGRRQVSIKDSAIRPLGFVNIRRRETDFSPPLWILAFEPLPLPSSGAPPLLRKSAPPPTELGIGGLVVGPPGLEQLEHTTRTFRWWPLVGWPALAGWAWCACLSVLRFISFFVWLL